MGLQDLLKEKPNVDEHDKPLWKCLVCEYIGTTLLIYIGCGSSLTLPGGDPRALAGVALCWGFLIATLGQSLGTYSCDLNPAITWAAFTTGNKPLVKALLYPFAQMAGCTTGAALLKVMTPDTIIGDFAITHVPEELGPWRGLCIEILITAWLTYTVFSAGDPERKDLTGSIPLSIGFCIGSIILFAAPFTGASMNPARSLGPAIVANKWKDHWIYWVGPIVGAQFGGHLYTWLFRVKWSSRPNTV